MQTLFSRKGRFLIVFIKSWNLAKEYIYINITKNALNIVTADKPIYRVS